MELIIRFDGNFNPEISTYNYFAEKQNEILKSCADRIILDFTNCKWFHASLISLLGGLVKISNGCNKSVVLKTVENSAVRNYFTNSGLFNEHFNSVDKANKNSIPLKEINEEDDEFINSYIDNILELAPIYLTAKCREAIFSAFYEIFDNAIEHSESKYGIHSGGYWFPKKQKLAFSLYDTGVGIPTLIKRQINNNMSSKHAFLWALQRGNSTKQFQDGIPRGVGFSNLIRFIDLNGGSLTIVSNDIMFVRKNKKNEFVIKKESMGTLISIVINSDYDHIYTYGKEESK